MRRLMGLWMIMALGVSSSCNSAGGGPTPASAEQQRRQEVTYVLHATCPGKSEVQGGFTTANDVYVPPGVIEGLDPNDLDQRTCFYVLNDVESKLCSAYAYLSDALSFDPTPSNGVNLDGPGRLRALDAAMHYASEAAQEMIGGMRTPGLTQGPVCPVRVREENGSYQRYASALLADAVEIADMASREGAEMAMGLSDALRSSVGSFSERIVQVWGREGESPILGRRADAFSWIYGLQVEAYSAVSGQAGGFVLDVDSSAQALPLCEQNGSDPAVKRGVELLLRVGVPVGYWKAFLIDSVTWSPWSPNEWHSLWHDPVFGPAPSDCLKDRINQKRHESGLTPENGYEDLSYQQILDKYSVTDETLEAAARALFDETRLRLFDLDVTDVAGASLGDGEEHLDTCYFLAGLDQPGVSTQRLEARARTGRYVASLVGTDFWVSVPGIHGLAPEASVVQENVRCMLEQGDCLSGYLGWVIPVSDPVAKHQLQSTLDYARGMTGSKSVDYAVHWISGEVPQMDVKVVARGLDAEEVSGLRYFLLEQRQADKYLGLNGELFKLMSCLQYGRYLGASCDVSSQEVCDGQQDFCEVSWALQTGREHLIVVASGDKVLDVAAIEVEATGEYRVDWLMRHYLDDAALRARVDKVIERRPYDCAAPVSNSLGLRYDMPVPLENELTSDSDTYEDSFAFYIQRARDAAELAGQRVSEAIAMEDHGQVASVQVENARQDALDRVEQICGEGRTSCAVDRVQGTTTLADLRLLPEVSSEPSCVKADTDWLWFRPLFFFDVYRKYVKCSSNALVWNVGHMSLEKLPTAVYEAARAGTLADLDFSAFGGEYKIALLGLKNSLVGPNSRTGVDLRARSVGRRFRRSAGCRRSGFRLDLGDGVGHRGLGALLEAGFGPARA